MGLALTVRDLHGFSTVSPPPHGQSAKAEKSQQGGYAWFGNWNSGAVGAAGATLPDDSD